ncbi:MAG: leucine--tRNA ligase [Firmicutes bacterium]|jgi:leucyl-tRNA synthetase|nr:leucine--tRNA ligase [Bacillota bacterium]
MSHYSRAIDIKWQKQWEEAGIYKFNRENADKKLYCLEMFSYPSGFNLHIGHWYNYGMTDCWSRMKRMQGFEVFHPMGFDAFGLPAENFAIQSGIHPQDSTLSNIKTMEKQLKEMGATFDWDYELSTCDPDYYRWTQWIFLQFYKNDLAYRKNAPVNWCPSCQTVLANEQVVEGLCERCDTAVTKENLTQWFFKTTAYAQELLDGLDDLDWPESTKLKQRNWIGRSVGAHLDFQVEAHPEESIRVFTTRADTLLGATYVVLAPEHPLVEKITTQAQREKIQAYVESTKKISEIDRLSTAKEKTGEFTGAFALHPISGQKLPIWVADYVLVTYGTGAVMAVPGHDERDFEFATKYDLPIPKVIAPLSEDIDGTLPYCEYGILVNSGKYNGLSSEEAQEKIVADLEKENKAEQTITYRLRDWLISRQRYWGAPIPIIYCPDCGTVPVPEADLPVLLPYDVEFTPDGQSPLAKNEDFVNTTCPNCQGPAKREVDTMDTFVDSSWYFLRYPDNKNNEKAWDIDWINKILPVDKYVGGPEHAVMHLIYARFFVKALRDLGYLNFDEPFTSLTHQGIILGPDGNRMSKSRGNVISPDPYVEAHGSDILRLFMGFSFAYTEAGPWIDENIRAMSRFIERIERWIARLLELRQEENYSEDSGEEEARLQFYRHQAIQYCTRDIEVFQFNTAIAKIMEFLNALNHYDKNVEIKNMALLEEATADLLRLLAPLAPHLAEENWQTIGRSFSIHNEAWPLFDENMLKQETIELAVQVNGRIRDRLLADANEDQEVLKTMALELPNLAPYLEGKSIVKIIVVKGRLINVVVK